MKESKKKKQNLDGSTTNVPYIIIKCDYENLFKKFRIFLNGTVFPQK